MRRLVKKILNFLYEGMVINGERIMKYGNWN